MIQRDAKGHVEDFVQGYFKDLKQEIEQAKALLEEVEGKFTQRLDSISQEPYLHELSLRIEALRDHEKALSRMAEALQTFSIAGTEEEVLDALTRFAQETRARALVLIQRAGSWVPFRDGKLNESSALPAANETVYQRAAERRAVVADESSRFRAHEDVHHLLGGQGSYCAAVPLIFGGSVPAVLYADVSDGQELNVAALEVLCQGARLAIRALRISEEVSLAQPQPRPAVVIPAPEPVAEPGPPAPPRTVPTPMMEKPADRTIDFSRDLASSRRNEFDIAEQALQEDIESSAEFRRRFEQAQTPPPPAPAPPAPSPTQQAPEVKAVEAPAAPPLTEEEERQHADARRFARLLVSELKLYNEQAVTEGRRNHDIYARLKQDIDRSRDMYGRRVPSTVTRRNDYFHEELVKLLAEGDASSLGSAYPGSQSSVN
ncbi:MAG TPA: hypothetical protein VGL91_10915 [Acidobacteriota bacterium]|jgi:hypothetical protein